MKFYYPYNFIPTDSSKTPGVKYDYPFGSNPEGASQLARHDLWQPDNLSGCIICSLKTVTPTIVGNEHISDNHQKKDSPATVTPYRWNGQTAIPANSLRGMIASTMESISQSSLRVLDKKYWPAFNKIHPNLLPWHDKRCSLTPAELLLGAVEDNEKNSNGDEGRALASRIRFHDALLANPEYGTRLLPQVTLVELASPKPEGEHKNGFKIDRPSPYFDAAEGSAINYDEVTNELTKGNLQPHGRKFYLLHHQQEVQEKNYVKKPNDSEERKMRCKAIMKETEFYFHISFDNISHAELTLLLKSLQPGPGHRSRIGLGKPLGLGIVTLGIAKILLTAAKDRYSLNALTQSKKYTSQIQANKYLNSWLKQSRYNLEAENIDITTYPFKPDNALINENAFNQVKRTGDINQIKNDTQIRWRNGRKESAAPLPPLSSNIERLLPLYGEQPSQPDEITEEAIPENSTIHRVKNYICQPDEEITAGNQWIRDTLVIVAQRKSFDDLETVGHNGIETLLTGNALAKKWEKLPQSPTEKSQFKSEVKELILASVEKRNLMLHRLAKKRYNNWKNPNQE